MDAINPLYVPPERPVKRPGTAPMDGEYDRRVRRKSVLIELPRHDLIRIGARFFRAIVEGGKVP